MLPMINETINREEVFSYMLSHFERRNEKMEMRERGNTNSTHIAIHLLLSMGI